MSMPSSANVRTISIAGIQLDIWTNNPHPHSAQPAINRQGLPEPVTQEEQELPPPVKDEEQEERLPISVLFILHGRCNDRTGVPMVDIVNKMLQIQSQSGNAGETKWKRELVIVTFVSMGTTMDHRNHGSRLVDATANNGWNLKDTGKHNQRHALDMYAIQVGTALDITTLIDFLPPYLYPRNERTIDQWGIAGFSLGGHSTWIAAKNEPLLEIVIPIVGCPDYLKLMSDRASRKGLDSSASETPLFPPALISYVEKHDPVAAYSSSSTAAPNPFLGKKILAIAGGKDPLVPWKFSAPFFNEKLDVGNEGVKENFIDEEAAHEWTEAMGERMAQFVEKWCLL